MAFHRLVASLRKEVQTMPSRTHGAAACDGAAQPAAPSSLTLEAPKYGPLDVRVKISVNPSQLARLKADAAAASLSISSYCRLCLECDPASLAVIESSPAFVRAADSGGSKVVQLRVSERLHEELAERADTLLMPFAKYARGIIMSQQMTDVDPRLQDISPVNSNPLPVVFRDKPVSVEGVALAESVSELSNQVRRLGYNVDNCLKALNTIVKRKGMRSPKVESLLEVTDIRLRNALDMRASLERTQAAVEAALTAKVRRNTK